MLKVLYMKYYNNAQRNLTHYISHSFLPPPPPSTLACVYTHPHTHIQTPIHRHTISQPLAPPPPPPPPPRLLPTLWFSNNHQSASEDNSSPKTNYKKKKKKSTAMDTSLSLGHLQTTTKIFIHSSKPFSLLLLVVKLNEVVVVVVNNFHSAVLIVSVASTNQKSTLHTIRNSTKKKKT